MNQAPALRCGRPRSLFLPRAGPSSRPSTRRRSRHAAPASMPCGAHVPRSSGGCPRDLSEPAGSFRSENLVSNEHTYQYVIPELIRQRRSPGGVYLGVAPDQNFTYIAAVRPRMAFILDIRRGNLLQHLLYKAVFELSADRAEFVSRLFSKPRPPGLTTTSTVFELFSAYARVATSEQLYRRISRPSCAPDQTARLHAVGRRSGAARDDLLRLLLAGARPAVFDDRVGHQAGGAGREHVSDLRRHDHPDRLGRQGAQLPRRPRTTTGSSRRLEEKNLIVPVMGDFAGPKALRSIGRYVRERGPRRERLLRVERRAVPVPGRQVRRVRAERGHAAGRRAEHLYPIGFVPVRLRGHA